MTRAQARARVRVLRRLQRGEELPKTGLARVSPVAWNVLDRLRASFRPYTISGTVGYGY